MHQEVLDARIVRISRTDIQIGANDAPKCTLTNTIISLEMCILFKHFFSLFHAVDQKNNIKKAIFVKRFVSTTTNLVADKNLSHSI